MEPFYAMNAVKEIDSQFIDFSPITVCRNSIELKFTNTFGVRE